VPFGLPLGGQPGDDRGAQPGRGAEERLQRGHEVHAGQPVQVQQRQHLGHLGATPTPAGQDQALKLHPLAGHRVDPPVVDPGADHLDLPGRGRDLARLGMSVAPDQSMPALVGQLVVGGQVDVDLGLQRGRQHPPRALTHELVQIAG
jgi:hypothetical protein